MREEGDILVGMPSARMVNATIFNAFFGMLDAGINIWEEVTNNLHPYHRPTRQNEANRGSPQNSPYN